ncbi:MAG: response regulator [Bryobacteraceae bacterium]
MTAAFIDFFRRIFSTDFMPHVLCLRDTSVIALHVGADVVIALSYFLIPAALVLLVHRRRDLAFSWMFILFGVFILSCGLTHILSVVTLWIPVYRLEGMVKVLTALASVGTAVLLFRLIPKLMLIPNPDELRAEIADRQRAEHEVRLLNQKLGEAAAEADAANHAKSAFLSTMSHEIRTPMNAILGYAQLMSRDPNLGPELKANLKIIGRSGEHLLMLINDVLDMSKIEAGRAEIKTATFSLQALLDDLAAMFRLRADSKALKFEMTVEGDLPLYVVGDEGKIRQTLINLLANAIKFTKRGRVLLHVTCERKESSLHWLSARVEDTGQGIAARDQASLFAPFRQVKGALNTQEGTGLGLAISREYARLMGGDITLTSVAGSGSVFLFEIPLQQGDSGVAVKRASSRHVIGIRAGTAIPGVLVVDDQFENRDWLTKLLTAVGYSVRDANNGEEAVRSWEKWKPGLILMDIHMPVMDGLEAMRIIKADPVGKDTPIIALTASAMDDDRNTAMATGADAFVAKPCLEDELLETMRSLLHITYDYEEVKGGGGSDPTARSSQSETLDSLAPPLLAELLSATLDGNKRLLDKLILQVRQSEDAGAADTLQNLADHYEYDSLTRLLEEACQR